MYRIALLLPFFAPFDVYAKLRRGERLKFHYMDDRNIEPITERKFDLITCDTMFNFACMMFARDNAEHMKLETAPSDDQTRRISTID